MKNKIAIVTLLVVGLVFGFAANAFAATYYVDPAGNNAADGSSDTPWLTIQYAINTVLTGDVIEVLAGTYAEDLVITTDNLELRAATGAAVTIQGVATSSGAVGGGPYNIDLQADGVKIHGFTIQSPNAAEGSHTEGVVLSGTNIEIYNNTFVFVNTGTSDDEDAVGIQTFRDNIPGYNSDISGLNIHDNVFQGSMAGWYHGVFINHTLTGTGTVYIRNNEFSGSIGHAVFTERDNTVIDNNVIKTDRTTAVYGRGIYVQDWDGRTQDNVSVTGNIVTGSAAGKGFAIGIRTGRTTPIQTLTNIFISANTVTQNDVGIEVRADDSGVVINNNTISGNTTLGVKNSDLTPGSLNAENNWWGDASGPTHASNAGGIGDAVTDNVDFVPWTAGGTPVVEITKGIEFYDLDRNGLIDRAVIWFTLPIGAATLPGTDYSGFSISGGYSFDSSQAPRLSQDNDGDGVVDGGKALTLFIVEGATYDTDVTPDVTYAEAQNITGLAATNGQLVQDILSDSAIEVDVAAPIIVSATTKDLDADGKCDEYWLLFSEPVTQGTTSANLLNGFNMTQPGFSFAATGHSTDGDYLKLKVNETVLNGGVILTFTYYPDGDGVGLGALADLATGVTGASAPNTFYQAAPGEGATLMANRKDGIAPIVESVKSLDNVIVNGHIDQILVEFSEAMVDDGGVSTVLTDGVSFIYAAAGWSWTPTNGVRQDPARPDRVLYTLTPSADFYDTEAVPELVYDGEGTLTDANDMEADAQTTSGKGVDGAAPVVVSATTGDNFASALGTTAAILVANDDPDGRLDTYVVAISEHIQTLNPTADLTAVESALENFTITNVHPTAVVIYNDAASTTDPVPTLANTTDEGDQFATLTIYYEQMVDGNNNLVNGGDTGTLPAVTYTVGSNDYITDLQNIPLAAILAGAAIEEDGANPFIRPLMIETGDFWGKVTGNVLDNGSGDGFVDNFHIYFTEAVSMDDATAVGGFTVDTAAAGKNTITMDNGADINGDTAQWASEPRVNLDVDGVADDSDDTAAAVDNFVIYGSSAKDGTPDTGELPLVDYTAAGEIEDIAGNTLDSFADHATVDKAPPVIVLAIGMVEKDEITVTFSEPVRKDDVTPLAGLPSDTHFGYADINDGEVDDSAGDLTTAVIVAISATKYTIFVDEDLTIDDVTDDLIWVKSDIEDLKDNAAVEKTDGILQVDPEVSIRITINDIIPPHLTDAWTLDVDNDGWIDHIVLTFNEDLDDLTLDGVVDADASGNPDVPLVPTTQWVIEGYTGATFNFFDNGQAGDDEVGSGLTAADEPYEGEYVHAGNAINDNVLVIQVDEQSAGANAFTGYGDTDAAPDVDTEPTVLDVDDVYVSGVSLQDFRDNYYQPLPSTEPNIDDGVDITGATDDVGAIVMAAQMMSEQTMHAWLSEKIDTALMGQTDFTWEVGTEAIEWASKSEHVKDLVQMDAGYLYFELFTVYSINKGNVSTIDFEFGANIQDLSAADNAVNLLGAVVDVDPYVASVGAPSALAITDVPDDNGGFAYFEFVVSSEHPGLAIEYGPVVSSYEIYRDLTAVDVTPDEWVGWAQVHAYSEIDADNKLKVIVPTLDSVESNWMIKASTAAMVSEGVEGVGKATAIPVATLMDGAAAKAADVVVSAPSEVAVGGAIDNIAPGDFTAFNAVDNPGAGAGVLLTWTAPADHGLYGTWSMNGVTYNIYGAEKYDIYRNGEVVGSALGGSTSYSDLVADGPTNYTYMVRAVDGNVLHQVYTDQNLALASDNIRVADFTSDDYVNISDFGLFGENYLRASTHVEWDPLFDLEPDNIVNISDFGIFGENYLKGTPPAGKLAEALNAGINVDAAMVLNGSRSDAAGSGTDYVVEVSLQSITELRAFDFTLQYDPEKVELQSIDGLSDKLSIVRSDKPGELLVAKAFTEDEVFDGTIRLSFNSTGTAGNSMMRLISGNLADEGFLANMVDEANLGVYRVEALPTVYALEQNFPNPFNPNTTIKYAIPNAAHVELTIINLSGQVVRTLVNDDLRANFYSVVWDGRNNRGEEVASGMYFYRIQADKFSAIKKLMLIK